MKRLLMIAALAACLGACAKQAPEGCEVTVTREIAFTADGAADAVNARSLGGACDQAIGVLAITTADGHPIWAYATPLARSFGDGFAEPGADGMEAFLARWAEAEITSTSQAPNWAQLTPGQTTLDRLTYDDIRARNLPMLCHFSGTGRQLCVFWEPGAGGAGHFLDRDIGEEEQSQ